MDAVVFGGLESGKVIRAGVYPPRVGVPDGSFEVGFEEGFGHIEYFTGVFMAGPGVEVFKEVPSGGNNFEAGTFKSLFVNSGPIEIKALCFALDV